MKEDGGGDYTYAIDLTTDNHSSISLELFLRGSNTFVYPTISCLLVTKQRHDTLCTDGYNDRFLLDENRQILVKLDVETEMCHAECQRSLHELVCGRGKSNSVQSLLKYRLGLSQLHGEIIIVKNFLEQNL